MGAFAIELCMCSLDYAMKVFHYAPLTRLDVIVNSGYLRPSNAGASSERPLLWFSSNQKWEPTATKMLITPLGLKALSFEQQASRFGCIRFGLDKDDLRLMSWKQACDVGEIKRDARRAMELYGRKRGAKSEHWHAVCANVSLSDMTFEIWKDHSWHQEN